MADSGTAGADISPPPVVPETRTAAASLTENIGYGRLATRILQQDFEQLHQRSHQAEWIVRTSERGRSSAHELLRELADLGFAWRDIARLVGVSVPAVQKWRRGDRTTGENRHRIASLLAGCDLVAAHYGVQEVASWFEMPLRSGIPVAPIELWSSNRSDLVFDYASGQVDAEQVLTAWDGQWRERYRSDFKTFRAGDGTLSIRPKNR